MIVLLHQPTGLVISLNQHAGHPGERFDERRSGLDHVGLAVERREDLNAWQAHLASVDVEHSPVADTEVGSALVFRDPDHIQLETWWSRPRRDVGTAVATTASGSPGPDLLYHSSPYPVSETVARLSEASAHWGSRSSPASTMLPEREQPPWEMPERQHLILCSPSVGTPLMLTAPDLALDLPTRLLVRSARRAASSSMVTSCRWRHATASTRHLRPASRASRAWSTPHSGEGSRADPTHHVLAGDAHVRAPPDTSRQLAGALSIST